MEAAVGGEEGSSNKAFPLSLKQPFQPRLFVVLSFRVSGPRPFYSELREGHALSGCRPKVDHVQDDHPRLIRGQLVS